MKRLMKNELEGVKPFNDFWFINCYYHQLIAGLSCLGIKKEGILLSRLLMSGRQFTTLRHEEISDKSGEKYLGYRNRRCNINEKSLIKHVDCGRPIIAGVDCFYLESRADTYEKVHAPHFILIYGYDLVTREINVVDHDYENSYLFKKKKISLDNLLEANRQYRKKGKKGFFTCRALSKKNQKKCRLIYFTNKEKILLWRKNSEENLFELKRLFTEDRQNLCDKAFLITEYLEKMRTQFLCVTCLERVKENEDFSVTSSELFQGYSNLLSLFWKMTKQHDFEYAVNHLEAILRKIDFILEREKRFFEWFPRCCNEKA